MPTSPVLGPSDMGKEDFLLLLVAQLRHQDPLSPLNAQDFAAQLAEFTALEQQIRTNELLEEQTAARTADVLVAQNQVAVGLIGKGVVTAGDQAQITGSGGDSAYVSTTGGGAIRVELRDAGGNVILSQDTAVSGAGVHRIDLGSAANGLPAGSYTVSVQVLGGNGTVQATPLSNGVVRGVRPGVTGPVLVVGTQEVQLSNVLEITN